MRVLLGIIIPAARVFCFCWQVFIPADDLFLLAITTVTNISAKFPYLKKGEYDIWAMKMQNFISSSDLLCWNIVLKGNSDKSMTTDNDGNLKIRPPVTTEEHLQVQREEKARTILLSALPDEHMGDFYHMIDEEGLDKGYDKMQKILTQMNTLKIKPKPKDVNMKFLRGLPPSWTGITLILKTKEGLEYISFDDLYNKLKFLKIDTKGYSSSSFTLSNAAFVSTAGSSQGNLSYQELGDGGYTTTLSVSPSSSSSKGSLKSKCSVVDDVIYSFFANHEIDQHLVYEDLDQMNKKEFKEYDLKHQMAMLSIKVHRFEKKHGRKIKFNGIENARFDKKLMKCFNCKQMGHFSRECQAQGGQNSNNYQKYKSKEVGKDGFDSKAMVVVDGSIDWDMPTEEGNTEPRSLENFGMVAGIEIEPDVNSKGEVVSADDAIPAGVSAGDVAAYVVSPQSETEFALMGLSTMVSIHVTCPLCCDFKYKLIEKDYQGQREQLNDCVVDLKAHKNAVKILEKQIKCHQKNQLAYEEKIRVLSHKLEEKSNILEYRQKLIDQCSRPNHSDHDSTDSISSVSVPASESRDTIVIDCDRQEDFPSVCGSYSHLIKDCDLHEQRLAKRNAEGKVFAGQPNPVSAGQQNPVFAGQQNPVSAGQENPVSAGQPNPVSAGEATLACNSIPLSVSTGDGILGPQPLNIQPKSTNVHSFTHNNQQIILSITHNSLYSLYMTGRLNRLEKAKDRCIVDSGCSRSMSGNKDKLEDFEDFDGGEVTFGGSTGKISGKGIIKTKTLNFENVLYVEEL
nr:ribonuclease H-like domain-containing protein [Tanacetum cinerariifolium]